MPPARRRHVISAFCGIMSGTARHSSARRSLTRLLDCTERGLAVEATRENLALLALGKKRCSGPCVAIKSLEDFYASKRGLGGRRSCCKDCMSLAGRERYTADLEVTRTAKREVGRRYREAHPERVRQFVDVYQERNREAVLERYGRTCRCCGSTDDLAIDHVNGDGGTHRAEIGHSAINRWLVANNFPEGFQTLCRRCNSSKAGGERCRIKHELDDIVRTPAAPRLCLVCDGYIDPVDYCAECIDLSRQCGQHRRPRKRVDAETCSIRCQNARRFTACNPPEVPDAV